MIKLIRTKASKINLTLLLVVLATILINLPLIMIMIRVDFSANENWLHFRQYQLFEAVGNTIYLTVFSLLLSGLIGLVTAFAVVFFDFPGQKLFRWLLYLPLTIPPYILAYVYTGLLGYTGFIQIQLRSAGISYNPSSFNIMNRNGAVIIYALTLYPYVFAVVRSFLENHSASLIESARVLGSSHLTLFRRVILPLVRIPLSAGLALVMMEVISDYGVIQYFNIRTISSAIFSTWFGLGDTSVAVRLSFYVMVFILLYQLFDTWLRGRRKYHIGSGRSRPIEPVKLNKIPGLLVTATMLIFLSFAFFIPVLQLLYWAWLALPLIQTANLSQTIINSMLVSVIAGSAIILISMLISHGQRALPRQARIWSSKLVQLGYSIPGAVIAVGSISLFVALDHLLQPLYLQYFPGEKTLWLSTSVIMLLAAFTVRYLAVGYNSVSSGFNKMGNKFSEAARTLGYSKTASLFKVELPVLRNSLIAGFILTFIDIAKELPLTLMLRPFNFNTLASRVYEYANDERIHEASVPALLLILFSSSAIVILAHIQTGYVRKGR